MPRDFPHPPAKTPPLKWRFDAQPNVGPIPFKASSTCFALQSTGSAIFSVHSYFAPKRVRVPPILAIGTHNHILINAIAPFADNPIMSSSPFHLLKTKNGVNMP